MTSILSLNLSPTVLQKLLGLRINTVESFLVRSEGPSMASFLGLDDLQWTQLCEEAKRICGSKVPQYETSRGALLIR